MKNDREQQILAMQHDEGVAYIAYAIIDGMCTYDAFVSRGPRPEDKRDVDNFLRRWLSAPVNKGKIIPGFNDRTGDESGE